MIAANHPFSFIHNTGPQSIYDYSLTSRVVAIEKFLPWEVQIRAHPVLPDATVEIDVHTGRRGNGCRPCFHLLTGVLMSMRPGSGPDVRREIEVTLPRPSAYGDVHRVRPPCRPLAVPEGPGPWARHLHLRQALRRP